MDAVLKWLILCCVSTTLLHVAMGTGYAYNSHNSFRPFRGPVSPIGHPPYSHDVYPPLRGPQFQRGPYPYEFTSQSDPLWDQFWDVYNYKGPLQEDPSAFEDNNYFLEESYFKTPDGFYHQELPRVPSVGTTRNDAYNRYKEYFSRRYGTRIGD